MGLYNDLLRTGQTHRLGSGSFGSFLPLYEYTSACMTAYTYIHIRLVSKSHVCAL